MILKIYLFQQGRIDKSVHVVGLIVLEERLHTLGLLLVLVGFMDLRVGEELDERLGDMLVVGETDFLVEKIALEDSVSSCVEDLDEDSGNHVGENEDDAKGAIR